MKNGIKVSTVEHALAALYAAGIDNCLIQVSGPEFPILDGSAKAYVENIQRVGIEEQNAVKDYYIINQKSNSGTRKPDLPSLFFRTKISV